MIRHGWVMVVGLIAGLNLLMVTANTALAYDLNGNMQADDRSRSRVSATGTVFNFVGWNMCDEDRVTCMSIWGGGWFNTNDVQITALGSFAKSEHRVQTAIGNWYALDLISSSDMTLTFRAYTSGGAVYVMLDEGDRKHPSSVCVYGPLVGNISQENAICKKDASVTIG
jgi:hypothetical protein